MVRLSPGASAPWVFAIDQLGRGRHGKKAYAERLIGSIRRKCVDHIVVFGERHLRHALEDMLGETMPLQNGIRAGNLLDQSSFSLLPLQPYFIAEVRCFALFRNYRGSFEIVFLLRFAKQLF